jgi:hypothetical protein
MAKTTEISVNVLDSDIVREWLGDVVGMGSERIRAVAKTLEVVGEYQRSSAEMKQDFKRVVKMLDTLAGWLEA